MFYKQIQQKLSSMCTKENNAKQNSKNNLLDLQQASTFSQKQRDLWITNKRLMKQIDILKMQIAEKDRIIKQLKVQIDSTILEDTKNKLNIMRMVEDEVNQKTQNAKQDYLNKLADLQINFQKKTEQISILEKQLQFEKENNKKMNGKIAEIREHVIVALDEKDLIIRELTKIINNYELDVKVQKIKKQAVERHQHNPCEQQNVRYEKTSNIQNNNIQRLVPSNEQVPTRNGRSKAHFKRNL